MAAPTASTLIDAVNKRDERVETVPRGEVLMRGQNFRTAHVFILSSNRSLLLQQLAPQRERHPGRWGSSVAAYLFAGESYLRAASRRMQEELGLVAPIERVGKMEMRDARSLKFVSLFLCRSDGGEIREPDHISQLAYWPIEQIEMGINREPNIFTPTFVNLFKTFGDQLQ
ncbi:MAG TPA: NUDIX domain-containing protein [Solirubrobacterales bacterium]|nr:NUDIX domain-containing protein [Solirubrobacterales bacterium]